MHLTRSLMWKSLFLFVPVFFFSFTSVAQRPNTALSSEVLQSCLLGTGDDVWGTLKLSYDQLTRIKFVQEACAEECTAAGAKKDPKSISSADGSTILAEVENILTPEQYVMWVNYCAGHASPKE